MQILFEARHALNITNHGKNNPYHNNRHIFSMAKIAELLYLETVKDAFNVKDCINLSLACLFHDFNHSGGTQKDFFNIRAAVISFIDFCDKCAVSNVSGIGYVDQLVVENIIRCTEYPFPRMPETLLEKCARDADLLYATLSMDPTIIMEDLRKEIMVSAKKDINYQEMLTGQKQFMNDVVMYTEAGQRLMDLNKNSYFDLLEKYTESQTNVVH